MAPGLPTRVAVKPEFELPISVTNGWQKEVLRNARLRKVPSREYTPELWNTLVGQETRSIHELWETFTQERSGVHKGMLNTQKGLVSYLLGFHLPNVARAFGVLNRAQRHVGFVPAKLGDQIHLIDIGCGTGAMTTGFLAWAQSQKYAGKIDCTLIDNSRVLFESAVSAVSALGCAENVNAARIEIEAIDDRWAAEKSTRVFLLGYVWNELSRNPRAQTRLLNILAKNLAAGKCLIIICEPANESHARAAMMLREKLVELSAMPIFPCPHAKPCPMLQRPKDWCFSEVSWRMPPAQRAVDKRIGLDREVVAVSGYVLASADLFKPKYPKSIVVGRPIDFENTGLPTILSCGDDGELSKSEPMKTSQTAMRGTIR